jgi:O6-methylguanine-DNA--protein-cysteine methyltransferase
VIAADGTIGGYSAGLAIKFKLLALEGIELDL